MARKPAAPKGRALKVFRTAIGFHDAYVAAPSRKAALTAWGADADLFARGVAEEVTDTALTAAPLADPGKVLRVARGTAAEHFAALPKTARQAAPPASSTPATRTRKARPKPPPSRARLDAAEAAIDTARARFRNEAAALDEREAALPRDRRAFDQRREGEVKRLEHVRDDARDAYDRAISKA